ncbi:hypothetical protein ACJJTC_019377 [Scirpophaga incertulas]
MSRIPHVAAVLEEDVICEACRDLAMAAVNSSLQSEVSGSDVAGPSTRRQTNACLLCGSSILNRRSDKILRENPNEMQQSIINLITSKLAPREPPPAEPAPSAEHAALAEHAPPAEHAALAEPAQPAEPAPPAVDNQNIVESSFYYRFTQIIDLYTLVYVS